MRIQEYQEQAARTSDPQRSQHERLAYAAIGLCGEAGELAELVKKHLWHGHDLDLAKVVEEIGDTAWHLSELCSVLELNFASVLIANIDKLSDRYPEGWDADRSRNRDKGRIDK